jgi:beta-glucosidase
LDGTVALGPATGEPSTMLGWRIDAERTAGVLHQVAAALPGVPLVVTENGIALRDEPDADGVVHDPARVAYLTDHLAAVLDVRAAGVPVAGWFAWSLLDNFEWAEGYVARFGLVHVERATMQRTPKTSFQWLRELAHGR